MPERVSRPKLVERLSRLWENYYGHQPYLKSVSIGNEVPLRGIKSSALEFKFPVTVICGPNGTGKTTFLALSVLAFHDEDSLTLRVSKRGYYDFAYFFGFSEKDKHQEGINITWEYTNDDLDSFKKGAQRWMRYIKNGGKPRRPQRGVEFVGLSRIVPAFEKRGYQGQFASLKKHKPKVCAEKLSAYLSRIMGRPYNSIDAYEARNSAGIHRLNDYNQTYTSFNAGAGDECLTYIVDTLLSAKEGSFIAIEEIEVGLHPATMEGLVDVILEIAYERKLQIIITSHSPEFLRACPKEALVLAERIQESVKFTHQPNVENAVHSVYGRAETELHIVCEDEIAASFINACLTKRQKNIVCIQGYGGQDELASKAQAVEQATGKKVLVIYDGDVAQAKLNKAKNDFVGTKISVTCLPGSVFPEAYIIEAFTKETIKEDITSEYVLEDAEWHDLKNKLATLSDPHDLFYILSQFFGYDRSSVVDRVCRLVQKRCAEDFEFMKKFIVDILERESKVAA